jgi:hypothetical protein
VVRPGREWGRERGKMEEGRGKMEEGRGKRKMKGNGKGEEGI